DGRPAGAGLPRRRGAPPGAPVRQPGAGPVGDRYPAVPHRPLELPDRGVLRAVRQLGPCCRGEAPGGHRDGAGMRRGRCGGAAAGPVVRAALESLRSPGLPASARVAPALAADLRGILAERPLRDGVTVRGPYTLIVQRRRALFSSWYEFFPRSEGAHFDPGTGWTSGTLRTAARSLDRIAGMGFDVAYLTPIHPIGTTFRKGRNNTLDPQPGDPGSPYAIG